MLVVYLFIFLFLSAAYELSVRACSLFITVICRLCYTQYNDIKTILYVIYDSMNFEENLQVLN